MKTAEKTIEKLDELLDKYFKERDAADKKGEILYGFDEVITLLHDIKIWIQAD